MAHARRKSYDLHVVNKSSLATQALDAIQRRYEVERAAQNLSPDKHQKHRAERTHPVADVLHH